jgi:hypothetical protein
MDFEQIWETLIFALWLTGVGIALTAILSVNGLVPQ